MLNSLRTLCSHRIHNQNKFRGVMSSDWGSNHPIHQSGAKEVVMRGSSSLLKR